MESQEQQSVTGTSTTGRNLEFLQNAYIEKQTSDFHASQLFKTRQGKDEKVTDWIHKIQILGSQFHEAALLDCSEGAQEGIKVLSDRLHNICFIQRLASNRIQKIVWSHNYHNFNKLAETALLEERYSIQATEILDRRHFCV